MADERAEFRASKKLTRPVFNFIHLLTICIVAVLLLFYRQQGVTFSSCGALGGQCMLALILTAFFVGTLSYLHFRNFITKTTVITDDEIRFSLPAGKRSIKWEDVDSIKILHGAYTSLVIELADRKNRIRFSFGLFDQERLKALLFDKISDKVEGKVSLKEEIERFQAQQNKG